MNSTVIIADQTKCCLYSNISPAIKQVNLIVKKFKFSVHITRPSQINFDKKNPIKSIITHFTPYTCSKAKKVFFLSFLVKTPEFFLFPSSPTFIASPLLVCRCEINVPFRKDFQKWYHTKLHAFYTHWV